MDLQSFVDLVGVDLLAVAAGLVLLTLSADALVNGAVKLGLKLRVPPMAVALTVVAAGTSLPELVVSARAALRGSPDIALGNVVGSNIVNIGVILGLSALLRVLPVESATLRRDAPWMLGSALLALPLVADGHLGRLEGLLLVGGFLTWTAILWRAALSGEASVELPEGGAASWSHILLRLAGGVIGLALGAELLVDGATTMARQFGVSERVIGLTLVAMGTSLPELATSVAAALRGRADVAVGNVVGSNIFNLLGILGLTCLIHPITVDPALARVDVLWMIGLSALLLPLMWTGRRVVRAEGGLLLGAVGAWAWTLL